ncbi:MAG: hypothetical protein IJ356_04425 [Erysipelotrichaceae bacterium]|nr:hypothetical protein [Erysipelotrichaceae bacterium]
METLMKVMKWIGTILLLLLICFLLGYLMDYQKERITESLLRNHIEKYVGEIEFLESKSELTSKGSYFRVKGYPHSIYSYNDTDVAFYNEKVNSIQINQLYYEEIKEVLENYFKDQEVVFHFTCGLSYLDSSQQIQEILDIDKSLVEKLCVSNSKEANFNILITAVFPSKSCIDLDETSKNLYLFLRDEYAEMNAEVSVYLANANDIGFFEDQKLYEYFSYADKRLTSQDACVRGKMDCLFWNDTCNAVSIKQPEGIMKQLKRKYEEFYGYRFNIVDYSCTKDNKKAVCEYTIERVKNGLTYEGMLEYEDCSSIKEHIETNKDLFKEQMKIK